MGTDILRIGNAGGYWGDDLGALVGAHNSVVCADQA